jgi:glycosyltransferase involved in cell wall biosynthesis
MQNNSTNQKLFIAAITPDQRANYFFEGLKQNFDVESLTVEVSSKEFFFWKNIFMTALELSWSALKNGHLPKISRISLLSNAYRRPQMVKKLSKKATNFVKSLNKKPDVIIQSAGMFKIEASSLPYVNMIDNYAVSPSSKKYQNESLRNWNSIYDEKLYLFQKELFSNAKYIFTFSKWCKDSLNTDYGIEDSKIIAMGWGPAKHVDPKITAKRPKSILGLLDSAKGGDLLLGCARFLPDFSFKILGKRQDDAPENVTFLGHVSDEELINEYQKAQFFFIFSEFDPSPHVVWEAQAHGCIIIGYDAFGISEAVIKGQTGILLKTRDAYEIAQAINQLLTKDLLQMQRAAIDNYFKNGTWGSVINRVSPIIQQFNKPCYLEVPITPST